MFKINLNTLFNNILIKRNNAFSIFRLVQILSDTDILNLPLNFIALWDMIISV
jgi:hypothetical protein